MAFLCEENYFLSIVWGFSSFSLFRLLLLPVGPFWLALFTHPHPGTKLMDPNGVLTSNEVMQILLKLLAFFLARSIP